MGLRLHVWVPSLFLFFFIIFIFIFSFAFESLNETAQLRGEREDELRIWRKWSTQNKMN